MNILFIIDPPRELILKKDSSFAMMKEAVKQKHQVYFCLQHDLYIDSNQLFCRVNRFELDLFLNHSKAYETFSISHFNVLFMRKDPPVDQAYLHTTYLLDIAEKSNVKILNKPSSIRSWNEKISILQFDTLIPKTLVTANPDIVKQFFKAHGDIILKPLDGMGGKNIFRVSEFEKNLNVILEIMTKHGRQMIMAQKYIPEIKLGDKRIIIIHGKPFPYALARIPMEGETRGNIASGGQGLAQLLSQRDIEIATLVGEKLLKEGLYFVGIDVIGDYLTEINVTSPTGIVELFEQTKHNPAELIINALH
ncbi:MAG: glutathione synthase [Candidatus Methylopumilus sp.]|nr:glutathione synthase [Candidatus Methylopumilus sp.]